MSGSEVLRLAKGKIPSPSTAKQSRQARGLLVVVQPGPGVFRKKKIAPLLQKESEGRGPLGRSRHSLSLTKKPSPHARIRSKSSGWADQDSRSARAFALAAGGGGRPAGGGAPAAAGA